jgi:branched-chain amino acid transport system ATP-binding protein
MLLLDEPSLGLSPKAMNEVFEKIREINKEGVGIVIVEQNAKKAVGMADKTFVLESGRIALQGDKSIMKNKKLREVYFGGE